MVSNTERRREIQKIILYASIAMWIDRRRKKFSKRSKLNDSGRFSNVVTVSSLYHYKPQYANTWTEYYSRYVNRETKQIKIIEEL